jgi:hypothetical protein
MPLQARATCVPKRDGGEHCGKLGTRRQDFRDGLRGGEHGRTATRSSFADSIKPVICMRFTPIPRFHCFVPWPLIRRTGSKVMTAWRRVIELSISSDADVAKLMSIGAVADGTGGPRLNEPVYCWVTAEIPRSLPSPEFWDCAIRRFSGGLSEPRPTARS